MWPPKPAMCSMAAIPKVGGTVLLLEQLMTSIPCLYHADYLPSSSALCANIGPSITSPMA